MRIVGTSNDDVFFAGQSRETVLYAGAGILAILACGATACCFRRGRKRADSDDDFGPPPPPPASNTGYELQPRSSDPRMPNYRQPGNFSPALRGDDTRSAMRIVAELEQRLGLFEANITGMEEVRTPSPPYVMAGMQ